MPWESALCSCYSVLVFIKYVRILPTQGVRGVLRNSEDISGLLQDWRQLDVEAMIMQPEAHNANIELFRESKYTLPAV